MKEMNAIRILPQTSSIVVILAALDAMAECLCSGDSALNNGGACFKH